ncbi:MAG: DUF2993 domain-containing protein [Symploca sp. SIO2C1]|nr:DUF2993 domain-containing protein [Symploca sp. SIO2C1]
MELFTILFSSFITLISPVNLVGDTVVENAIRSRLEKVEQLEVRIDNAPSHQITQGKLQRVRIASRGLQLTSDLRISTLELDIDQIDVDLQALLQKEPEASPDLFRKPLQAGVRLVLTEDDINQALQSPKVTARISQSLERFLQRLPGAGEQDYELLSTKVQFLEENRLAIQLQFQGTDTEDEELKIRLETGLEVENRINLKLIEPLVSINDTQIPPLLVAGLKAIVKDFTDLGKLDDSGILVRILKLEISSNQLELANFVRVDESAASKLISGGSIPQENDD